MPATPVADGTSNLLGALTSAPESGSPWDYSVFVICATAIAITVMLIKAGVLKKSSKPTECKAHGEILATHTSEIAVIQTNMQNDRESRKEFRDEWRGEVSEIRSDIKDGFADLNKRIDNI